MTSRSVTRLHEQYRSARAFGNIVAKTDDVAFGNEITQTDDPAIVEVTRISASPHNKQTKSWFVLGGPCREL